MNNVLITGATRGIGHDIAKTLCNDGFSVFITGRNREQLSLVAQNIGAKGFLAIDLAQKGALEKLFEEAEKTLGSVDILINNAGEYVYSPIEHTPDADIEKLFLVNAIAPYTLSKLCAAGMKGRKEGRIINIGSISGVVGEANASLYAMTKSAFFGLTKSLALELAPFGITVNTINPGWVKTELAGQSILQSDFSQEEILETIPQNRFIEPCEISSLVKYLISEEAKGLTGQAISLCAGLSAG